MSNSIKVVEDIDTCIYKYHTDRKTKRPLQANIVLLRTISVIPIS